MTLDEARAALADLDARREELRVILDEMKEDIAEMRQAAEAKHAAVDAALERDVAAYRAMMAGYEVALRSLDATCAQLGHLIRAMES